MYRRLCNPLKSRSFFLLGPRGTGKTWLTRELFNENSDRVVRINLLNDETYLELLANPGRIARYTSPNSPGTSKNPLWIVIDEVQRVPSLLHEVHNILEDPAQFGQVHFALTGSSARKLKKTGVDLLAGRALLNYMFPLSFLETEAQWSLEQTLNWGSLPAIVTADSDPLRAEILRAYNATYIKEEIKEEQIVRNLEPFIRFLEVAAQANGETVTFSKIADAALVNDKAVARYFQILEDTLLGFWLPPFTRSARKRTMQASKFYLFDPGVKKALERSLSVPVIPGISEWGRAFEHNFILECLRLNSYYKRDAKLSYLRTNEGAEIDLILEFPGRNPLCIEIKSSRTIRSVEINKLIAITSAVDRGEPLIAYGGEAELEENGVRMVPWDKLLRELWIR